MLRLCGFLLLLVAPPAFASMEAGEYRGKFREKGSGHVVGVALTLLPARYVGDPAGRLRFGPGWNCGFDLQFTGTMGQLANYNFVGITTGACKTLAKHFMRVHPRGNGGLQIEFIAPDGRMTRKFGMSKPK